MGKSTKHQLEVEFQQQIYFDHTVVPNLLLRHYGDLGLTDKECIQLLTILGAFPKGKKYITYSDIKDFWQEENIDLQTVMTDFIKRKFLTKVDGKTIEDGYSLDGMFEKLFELWVFLQACPKGGNNQEHPNQKHQAAAAKHKDLIKQVYAMFEGEFGRPLSPTEIETINKWLVDDNWGGEMIKEALKRAVLHGTYNLIYIDKILFRWQKEGICSLEQLSALESTKTAGNVKKPAKKPAKTKIMENDTDYSDIYKF